MDRFTIRMATLADAAAVAEVYRPYVEGTVISFEAEAPGAQEMAARIGAVLEVLPWLVCEEAGRVVGYAYASRHRDRAAYRFCVDAGVYVDGVRHRAGIGRALYTALFVLLRRQGFHAVHAGVTLPNAASVGLHEAMGFQPVGVYRKVGWKMGAWRDVGWWQLELRERGGPPAEPLSMAELRTTPELGEALRAGEDRLRQAG